tara:strand:+ start:1556 stop:3169 length:1614 start_codon:yes stop_codon:yes gene_type:complete
MVAIVLAIITVFVIIAIVMIHGERKPREKPKILIDPEAKKLQIKEEIEEEQDKNKENGVPEELLSCVMVPNIDGDCPLSFLEFDDTGCCSKVKQPDTTDMYTDIYPKMGLAVLEMIGMLAFEIFLGVAFEAFILSTPHFILNSKYLTKVMVKAGAEGAKKGLKTSAGLMVKSLMTAMAKVVQSVAFKWLGRALAAIEIASFLLDVFDPSGFSAFIPNSASEATRNQILVSLMLSIPKKSYPPIFSASIIFPDVFKIATTSYMTEIMPDVMKRLQYDYSEVIMATMEKAERSSETDPFSDPIITSLITQTMDYVLNSEPVRRDTFIYNKMISIFTELGGNGENDIELHTELSTTQRYGVTITKSMAEKWNKKHNETWKKYDYTKGGGEPPPMVAIYTDKYMYLDEKNPGKYYFDPNLVEKTLTQKVALALPLGQVIQHCEATERYATYMGFATNKNVKVNPFDHGVRFNPETGTCKYTPDYCSEVGLDYQSGGITDCDYYEGQEVAEMLFGTALTRYTIQGAHEVKEWLDGAKGYLGL